MTRSSVRALAAAGCVAALTSCASDFTRSSHSPSFLILDSIVAASGAEPGTFSGFLNSDVITIVEVRAAGQSQLVPTMFNDPARASMRISLRNPGTVESPVAPSEINEITITRYRVNFRRADGRNTPGVDVPYPFDGGVTATIPGGAVVTFGFELVRHLAKAEPPLRNLAFDGGARIIGTIAEVTFFGRDQAGNEVSVTGNITVNFADFGDPQ